MNYVEVEVPIIYERGVRERCISATQVPSPTEYWWKSVLVNYPVDDGWRMNLKQRNLFFYLLMKAAELY